jgi:RimJ/RimL family protein N-acetyltransferase
MVLVTQAQPNFVTSRLIMRRWQERDKAPFASLNADARVMAHFPKPLSREESDYTVERIEARFEERGFGLWALEERSSGRFVGFTGLSMPSFAAQFTPCVEVGWRLAYEFWGQGYALEAARRSLTFAFDELRLQEVVSMTAANNIRSRRVMERLSMTHDPSDDFDHPNIPAGHPVQRHVLYRLKATDWQNELKTSHEGAA